jgi:hypothetical protein
MAQNKLWNLERYRVSCGRVTASVQSFITVVMGSRSTVIVSRQGRSTFISVRVP